MTALLHGTGWLQEVFGIRFDFINRTSFIHRTSLPCCSYFRFCITRSYLITFRNVCSLLSRSFSLRLVSFLCVPVTRTPRLAFRTAPQHENLVIKRLGREKFMSSEKQKPTIKRLYCYLFISSVCSIYAPQLL